MTSRRVTPRRAAAREIEFAVDYYTDVGGEALANRFVGALESVYVLIGENPKAGSSALGASVGLPNLRTWNLRGFPYVICYVEETSGVEIVRVLQGQRDLLAELSANGD